MGLFGLAGMLLIVSLASVIMDRAAQADRREGAGPDVGASASAQPANDPLVDMGVAPELSVRENAAKKPAAGAPAQR